MKWCVLFSVDDAGFDGLKLHMVNRVYSIDRGRIEVWVDNDVDVINIVDHSPIGFKVQLYIFYHNSPVIMKSKYFFKTFFLSNLRNSGTFRFVSIFKIFRSSLFFER